MSSEYTTLVQGLETYRLADLRPYHANPRRGDVAQIARSLSRTGQYRPIVVNAGTKTGRYREVPKPVAMVSRALVSSSPAGALVLEPFAGTGSTLIAAHDTGRVCYTAELSPAYVDTTVRRWQQHTGGTPQRNGVPHSLEP